MSTYDDDFTTLESPERLHYATGVFLDAEDMKAEQLYHRGRLSRVLAYLHGSGTAAGLEVVWDEDSDELIVGAGVAIDRVGRLIEVPKQACLSLGRWFDYQVDKLAHPDEHDDESKVTTAIATDPDGQQWLVADVFVRFAVCPRGRTPAFAFGPFDAIDATVPHRLRDSYELSLVLRGGDAAGLPGQPWPARAPDEDVEVWQRRMERAVLEAWRHGTDQWKDGRILPDASTDGVGDPSSVFLARLRLPITQSEAGLPQRARDEDGKLRRALVDNHSRRFVYSSGALIHWVSAMRGTFRPA